MSENNKDSLDASFQKEVNNGFYIDREQSLSLQLEFLSEESVIIIKDFAEWLNEEIIALEICNHKDLEYLMLIFNRSFTYEHSITKRQREVLKEIKKRSEILVFSKFNYENDEKVRSLERELRRIENFGLNRLYYEVDSLNLKKITEKTKVYLMKIGAWLNDNKIALEICSTDELCYLMRIYARQRDKMQIAKKLKEILKEVINRSYFLNKMV